MIEFETYWDNDLDPNWHYSAGYIEDLKAYYTFNKKGDDSVLITATVLCDDFELEPDIVREDDGYYIKEALLYADGIDYSDEFVIYKEDEHRYYRTDINGVAEFFGCSVNDIKNHLNSKEVIDYITNCINEYDIADYLDIDDFEDEDDDWIGEEADRWYESYREER